MTVSISAVVCTHNRAEELEACLRSLCECPSVALAEVIVVDNASTDRTRLVAADYADRMPALCYVYEPRLGLPFARNSGWRAASSDIVLYLDDDAAVTDGAIDALASLYARSWDAREAVAVGTRVLPTFIDCDGYPDWLHADFVPYLTQLDLGQEDRVLGASEFLVGASFSTPRCVLEDIGGFNENLPAYGMDERWVEEQIKRLGGRLLYCGRATVQHAVTPVRLQKKWFYRRMYLEGVAARRLFDLMSPRGPVPIVLSFVKHALRAPLQFLAGFANVGHRRKQDRFRHFCAGFVSLGHMRALWGGLF